MCMSLVSDEVDLISLMSTARTLNLCLSQFKINVSGADKFVILVKIDVCVQLLPDILPFTISITRITTNTNINNTRYSLYSNRSVLPAG